MSAIAFNRPLAHVALACAALVGAFQAFPDMLTLEWAGQFESVDEPESEPGSVSNTAFAIAASGSMYIVGRFGGTVDFDLGPTVHSLTASSANDLFVTSLDSEGAFVWATQLKPGSSGNIDATTLDIDADAEGNVYIAGIFHGTVDFDPGIARRALTSLSASGDIFAMKLDEKGKFLWVRHVSATQATSAGIAVNADGDVYVGGNFFGAADLDPGLETFTLTSLQGTSHFIAKWDTDGVFLWANQLRATTSSSTALGQTLAVDSAGNVLTAGTFTWSVEFDSDPTKAIQTSSTSVFLVKFDDVGEVTWAKQFDQIDMEAGAYGLDLDLDGSGNIFFSGLFKGAIECDPDGGTFVLSAPPGEHAGFVTKLTASGNFVWAIQTQAFGSDLNAILTNAVADSGEFYSAGPFADTIDLDPGIEEFELESMGGTDIFVRVLEADGDFDTAQQFGDEGADTAFHIGVDETDALYIVGTFTGTVDFDAGPGIYALTAPEGQSRTFIMKLSPVPCTPPPAVTGIAASDGLEADGVEVTWDAVMSGQAEFQVLRSNTDSIASAVPLSGWIRGTSYLDDTADSPTNGPLNCNGFPIPEYTTYYYWVQWRAQGTPCISEPSLSDSGYRGGPPAEVEPAGAPDLMIAALLLMLLFGVRRHPRQRAIVFGH